MATHNVKWYRNAMGGAPALTDYQPGGLIAVLKGCLIDGFGDKTPTSLTYDIPSNRVTATFAADHEFLEGQIIEISGANEAAFNGQFRVLDENFGVLSFEYEPDTAPPASATGTLNCKTPELGGWSITYEDAPSYLIVFERTAPEATEYKIIVRNDQDYSTNQSYGNWMARFDIITDWVSIDDYNTIHQSWVAAGWRYASEDWLIIGDHLLFYFGNTHASSSRRSVYMFGDINTVKAGDKGHFAAVGNQSNGADARWNNSGYRAHTKFAQLNTTHYRYLMTNWDQSYPAVLWSMLGYGDNAISDEMTYPNAADGGFYFAPCPMMIEENNYLRGYVPGVIQPLMRNDNYHNTVLWNVPEFGGNPIICRLTNYEDENNSTQYMVAFRLDDWRVDVG